MGQFDNLTISEQIAAVRIAICELFEDPPPPAPPEPSDCGRRVFVFILKNYPKRNRLLGMKKKEKKQQSIIIFKDSKGNVELKADVQKETIWATQDQIAGIFGIDRTVVTKHIRNIIKDKELDVNSVSAKFAHTAKDKKVYQVQFYNLDIILAVGYRTNSTSAINFRRWATSILRDYIVKGAVINTERIKKLHKKGINDLRSKIEFIQNTIKKRELDKNEVDSLLSVISDYANSWTLLKEYDDGEMTVRKGKSKEKKVIDY